VAETLTRAPAGVRMKRAGSGRVQQAEAARAGARPVALVRGAVAARCLLGVAGTAARGEYRQTGGWVMANGDEELRSPE